MYNYNAKAYAKLALERVFKFKELNWAERAKLGKDLDIAMEYFFETYTEEEAYQVSEFMRISKTESEYAEKLEEYHESLRRNPKQLVATRVVKFDHDTVKAKYREFVDSFFCEEEGVTKMEMLPDTWVVDNERSGFHATIECEYQVRNTRTNTVKDWFAVVKLVNEKQKRYFPLEIVTD